MQVITSESVFSGHPDKVCDQISDAILDAILEQDKHARVAVETAIKDDLVFVFGEVTTTAKVDYKEVAKKYAAYLCICNICGLEDQYENDEN